VKTVMAALASLTFFVGLLIAPPAQAQKLQQVRIALSTPTPHMAPLYVGRDKKFYEKYGLDVQLILVNSGSLVAQMFASGELQMTANAPASLVNLAATGEKISFFLGLSNTSPFTVVTQPNLRRAEDLKGKRIGTARFGGSSHISALIALEHLKLDLKRDKIVSFRPVSIRTAWRRWKPRPSTPACSSVSQRKSWSARATIRCSTCCNRRFPIRIPDSRLKKTTPRPIPKVIDGFTRATIEAYGYIFKKENKQAVKEVLARNLRLANLDAAEDFYLEAQEELDRKPYPSLEGFKVVIKYVAEQNPKAAAVKVEEIVDSSWLKKLDTEGFFEKVYGGK
jgi:hypothetical protein